MDTLLSHTRTHHSRPRSPDNSRLNFRSTFDVAEYIGMSAPLALQLVLLSLGLLLLLRSHNTAAPGLRRSGTASTALVLERVAVTDVRSAVTTAKLRLQRASDGMHGAQTALRHARLQLGGGGDGQSDRLSGSNRGIWLDAGGSGGSSGGGDGGGGIGGGASRRTIARRVFCITFSDGRRVSSLFLKVLAATVWRFSGSPLHVLGLSGAREPAVAKRWRIERANLTGSDPGKLKKLFFFGALLEKDPPLPGMRPTDLLLFMDAFDVLVQRPLQLLPAAGDPRSRIRSLVFQLALERARIPLSSAAFGCTHYAYSLCSHPLYSRGAPKTLRNTIFLP